MKARKFFTLFSLTVLLSLLMLLVFPMSALADGPTPPPDAPTEAVQPTDPPAEAPAPTAAGPEAPVVTEPPAATEAPAATQPPAATEAPVDLPPVTEAAPAEPTAEPVDLSEVVSTAADTGVTLADSGGQPLQLTTNDAANTLATGDPYFTRGSTTYYFRFPGDCGSTPNCVESTTPIQDALDDIQSNGLPSDGTLYVEAGTYHESITINTNGLTLWGDPSATLPAVGASGGTILDGTGLGADSVGITINAEGVSIINFLIENYGTAIMQPVVSGKNSNYIEHNTIKDNDNGIAASSQHGSPALEIHYNIFENNNGYDLINSVMDTDNNTQYIQAQNNYWGCAEGPVVVYDKDTKTGGLQPGYIQWAHGKYNQMHEYTMVGTDTPNPDCALLFGHPDNLYNNNGQGGWYDPYKIVIDAIIGPTPTPTTVPPTNTPTSTPTDVPPTNTPTNTPTGVPPTSTPTNTPTGVPPTSTPTTPPPTKNPPPGFIPVTSGEIHVIAAGWAHTCVITPEGGVQCWGNNAYGQLGDGTNNGSNLPVEVVGLTGGTNIVAGANHTCVQTGSVVWCWGQNNKGQIGDGTTTDRNKPVQVLSGVANITAGLDYTCAVMLDGHVLCWGNNENGQLADGTKISHTLPSPARLITGVSNLDGGQNKTCGINGAGLITCWSGGGAAQTLSPVVPVTGTEPEINTDVAVNRFSSLVVGLDEQGMPVTFQSGQAKLVSSLTGVIDIDSGLLHVCALLRDGSVKCWGANNYGQLGDNSTASSQNPVSVVDLPAATDMAVGRNHACVIYGNGVQNTGVMCWGLNSDGQLGDGTLNNSLKPVEVLFGE